MLDERGYPCVSTGLCHRDDQLCTFFQYVESRALLEGL
jgi:hypothetical protein